MSVFEERGSQETTSSQVKGCSEGNNIKQAMKPVGLREQNKGEEDTSVGRSVRLSGFGMGNLDGTRTETSG